MGPYLGCPEVTPGFILRMQGIAEDWTRFNCMRANTLPVVLLLQFIRSSSSTSCSSNNTNILDHSTCSEVKSKWYLKYQHKLYALLWVYLTICKLNCKCNLFHLLVEISKTLCWIHYIFNPLTRNCRVRSMNSHIYKLCFQIGSSFLFWNMVCLEPNLQK